MDEDYAEIIENSDKVVIGLKQTLLHLAEDRCGLIIVAEDCDEDFKHNIISRAMGKDVKVVQHFTRSQLGAICKIDVKAGVVAILK